MRKKGFSILILFLVAVSIIFGGGYSVENKKLNKSKIFIVKPDNWNKNVIYFAHGYRRPESPLYAAVEMESGFFRNKVDEGWMVAATSYRRNGVIIDDGVTDMNYLRDYVRDNYAGIQKEYIIGSSMGGLIATLMAERTNNIAGVVAIGAALQMDDNNMLNYSPKTPLIFLYNSNEKALADKYIKKTKKSPYKPVIWFVNRRGHCRVLSEEIDIALSGVINYMDGLENNKDISQPYPVVQSRAEVKNKKVYTKIFSLDPGYGNLNTGIIQKDLNSIGIKEGDYFELRYNNKEYRVYWGSYFNEVPLGEFVAYINMDGYLTLGRYAASIKDKLDYTENDLLVISKLKNQPKREFNIAKYHEAINYNNMAMQYLYDNRPGEAIKLAEKALKIAPDDTWMKLNQVTGYLLKGNFKKAVSIYNKNKNKILYTDISFKEALLEDIKSIEEKGINHENFNKFKREVKN